MPNRKVQFLRALQIRTTLLLLVATVLLGTTLWAQQAGPDVVYAVAPDWPTLDKQKAEQPHKEVVLVKIEVDGFGNVVDRKLLTPRSIYSNSAEHAASLWKFGEPVGSGPNPAKLNGMTATLKFTFELLPPGTPIDETGTAFIPPYEVSLRRVTNRQP